MKRTIEIILGIAMLAILAWLLVPRGALPRVQRNMAAGFQGALLVASSDGRLTTLGLFEAPDGGLLAGGVIPRGVQGVASSRDGERAFCWTDRRVYTVARRQEDLDAPEMWQSEHEILQVIEVHPPSSDAARLLVLSAEDTSGEQPLGSHLTLVDPSGAESAREVLLDSAGYNFWRASVGDVDGDGAEDLALCTWSHTARGPEMKRRFFVYSWDDQGGLTPRWRGSRLSRPYISAQLAQVLPDERMELVSVEKGLTGQRLLVAYEWNQFGFWGLGHSEGSDHVVFVGSADVHGDSAPELLAIVRHEAQPWRVEAFEHTEDALEPVAQSLPLEVGENVLVIHGAEAPMIVAWHGRGPLRPREIAFETAD